MKIYKVRTIQTLVENYEITEEEWGLAKAHSLHEHSKCAVGTEAIAMFNKEPVDEDTYDWVVDDVEEEEI